jgi:heme a synthase
MTSRWWDRMVNTQHATRNTQPSLIPSLSSLQKIVFATTALILFQLILGATMRHQHAGLSIRDFPLAYGKLWPATDPASIQSYNAHRMETTDINPITAFQVQLQMVHRLVAVLILLAVGWCAVKAWRKFPGPLAKISAFWFCLILCQATLGAATVLSGKAADIATLHVLVGALSLVTGTALSIIALRFPQSAAGISPTEAVLKQQSAVDLDEVAGIGTAGKMPTAH